MQCSVVSGPQGGGPGLFITQQPQQARPGQPAAPATSAWPGTSASMLGSGGSRHCSCQGPRHLTSSASSLGRSGHRRGGRGGPREEAAGGGATEAGQKVPEWPEDMWQERNRLRADPRAGQPDGSSCGVDEASSGESWASPHTPACRDGASLLSAGPRQAQLQHVEVGGDTPGVWGSLGSGKHPPLSPLKTDPGMPQAPENRPTGAGSVFTQAEACPGSAGTHLLHVIGPVASAALSTLEFSTLHPSPGASPASSPAPSRRFVILSQRGGLAQPL